MTNNLDFLNKNMYRKYPLRENSTLTYTDGSQMPQELITSMQITSVYGVHTIYITKVFTSEDFISVTIYSAADNTALGTFTGPVNKDFDVVPLTPFVSRISGHMTVGKTTDLIKNPGVHFLRNELTDEGEVDNALLEDSVIFCTSSSNQDF